MSTRDRDTYTWEILDLRPCGEGYRVVWLAHGGPGVEMTPVVGWLLEEQRQYLDDELVEGETRSRRISPGVLIEGGVESARDHSYDESSNFWFVLAPGDPEPTDADVLAERGRRARPRAA